MDAERQSRAMAMATTSNDRSGSIRNNAFSKEVESVGQGFEMPTVFSVCRLKVDHQGTSNDVRGELFDFDLVSKNSMLRIGDGCSFADTIIERCLMTMRAGETCLLRFPVSDEVVSLRLTLEAFDGPSPAPFWEMNSEELLAEAVRLKSRGVQLYRTKPQWASRLFVSAAKHLIAMTSTYNKDGEILLSQCYANLAACQLLVPNHEHAIVNCNKALALDAGNIKCMYRRAVAAIALQRYETAAVDLKELLRLDPSNAAAVQLMETLKSKTRAHEKSLGTALGKLFN